MNKPRLILRRKLVPKKTVPEKMAPTVRGGYTMDPAYPGDYSAGTCIDGREYIMTRFKFLQLGEKFHLTRYNFKTYKWTLGPELIKGNLTKARELRTNPDGSVYVTIRNLALERYVAVLRDVVLPASEVTMPGPSPADNSDNDWGAYGDWLDSDLPP